MYSSNNNNNNNNNNNQQQHYPSTMSSSMMHNENGPRAKCDQVIFEAMAKAVEIIVHGRTSNNNTNSNNSNNSNTINMNSRAIANNGNGSSSSRFNLIVPEVPEVRQILQGWRRVLHVPLRIDFYYETESLDPNTQQQHRERHLLESWFLEYSPSSSTSTSTTTSSSSTTNKTRGAAGSNNHLTAQNHLSDPIVQLRHVCKMIVIWLRNLYCSSRLLPAQNFHRRSNNNNHHRNNNNGTLSSMPPVRYSIDVLPSSTSDDKNVITTSLQQQGFLHQMQPSGVVTPYGEVVWKVYYAPHAPLIRDTTSMIPALMPQQQVQQQQQQQQQEYQPPMTNIRQQQQQQQSQPLMINGNNGNSKQHQQQFATTATASKPMAIPRHQGFHQEQNQHQHQHQHQNNNDYGDNRFTYAAAGHIHNNNSNNTNNTAAPQVPQSAPTGGNNYLHDYRQRQQQQQQQRQDGRNNDSATNFEPNGNGVGNGSHNGQYSNSNNPLASNPNQPPRNTFHEAPHPRSQYFDHSSNNNSNTNMNQQQQQPQQQQQQQQPNRMMQGSNTDNGSNSNSNQGHQLEQHHGYLHEQQHHHPGNLLQRRNTSIGMGYEENAAHEMAGANDPSLSGHPQHITTTNLIQGRPERIMSGLSLAMMGDDDDHDGLDGKDNAKDLMAANGHATTATPVDGNPPSNNKDDAAQDSLTSAQVEKRRAALHHVPPYHQQPGPVPNNDYENTTGNNSNGNGNGPNHEQHPQYGYAYNNQISWQQIRPSTNVPVSLPGQMDADDRSNPLSTTPSTSYNAKQLFKHSYSPGASLRGRLSSSPSPLAGTPPAAAFLSKVMASGQSKTSPMLSPAGSLIPPRNLLTPPFPSQPVGFVHDAPPPPSPMLEHQQQLLRKQGAHEALQNDDFELPPPMTTLDLLHSSPFQQSGGGLGMSSLSMIMGGPGDATFGKSSAFNSALASTSSAMVMMTMEPTSPGGGDEEEGENGMPFAVDADSLILSTPPSTQPTTHNAEGGSVLAGHDGFGSMAASGMGSSAAVSSFAQKCAPDQQRLKMFASSLSSSSRLPSQQQQQQTDPSFAKASINTSTASVETSSNLLSSQLADYHNFGASLLMSIPSDRSRSGSDEGGGSSITPIPLRTA